VKRNDEQWEFLYKERLARLKKLIDLKAPQVAIDTECRLVRHAIHKGKSLAWHDFKRKFRSRLWDFRFWLEDLVGAPDSD